MTPELRAKIEELIRRWDGLGKYKDDDFGEVEESVEKLRSALSLPPEPKAPRYLRAKCATCGHKKGQHIYGDGGCRPGFKCQWNCERFVPYPAESEPGIEQDDEADAARSAGTAYLPVLRSMISRGEAFDKGVELYLAGRRSCACRRK